MKETLIISQNLSASVAYFSKHKPEKVIYSPCINSQPQMEYFHARFLNLSKLIPGLKLINLSKLKPEDIIGQQLVHSFWGTSREKELLKSISLEKEVQSLSPNTLFKADDIEFNNKFFFTPFRKKYEVQLPDRFEDCYHYSDDNLDERLNYYFNQSQLPSSYFDTRNGLLGQDFSTQLSSYLACGALDVKYLYNLVKDYEEKYGPNKSTYWIIFELMWREFFFHSGQHFKSKIFSKNGLFKENQFSKIDWSEEELLEMIRPNKLIHSAYSELVTTGFQSNRVRQIFASYLINDLNLDWRIGAELFEKYLIDYDVYSNYGNWQYQAGVGHDPRGKRYFNQEKQLKNYDPKGKYLSFWSDKLIN